MCGGGQEWMELGWWSPGAELWYKMKGKREDRRAERVWLFGMFEGQFIVRQG